MKNVAYDCTLAYGTWESFGRLYSFCVNVYLRSYITGNTNQRIDK